MKHNGVQDQICKIIRLSGKNGVKHSSLLRCVPCLSIPKAVLRLKKKGFPIVNLSPDTTKEAVYAWMPEPDREFIEIGDTF